MNTPVFFAVFSALIIIYFFVAMKAAKKVVTTSDYFLAGRNLTFWQVTFTLLATQIGGGMLLGTAQEAYQVGLYGLLYNISMVIGFFMLASGIASRLQSMGVSTTAEIFETHYQSLTLKKFASLCSIVTLCGILASQIVASKALLSSLNVQNELIFIIFWAAIIIYTMTGGLHAVVAADTYQVAYILTVFLCIMIMALITNTSCFFSDIFSIQNTYFSTTSYSNQHYIATLMMPALFSLIEQDLAQRFFAARTKTIATMAAFTAGAGLLLFSLIPIYFGIYAKYAGIALDIGTNPLIPGIELVTNEYIVVFAVCGIIAAITSTADSLLCAISSNITQDFIIPYYKKGDRLKISKIATCIIGATIFILSYFMPRHIIDLLVSSYALSVNGLLVPLLGSYFLKNLYKKAATASIIAGLTGYGITFFMNPSVLTEVIPLIASFITYTGTTCWYRYAHKNQILKSGHED